MSKPVTAEELDNLMGGTASSIEVKPIEKKRVKKESSLTAEDLDAISQDYSPPSPFNKPTKVASFETQEEAAKFVKDMSILAGQGAVMGTGEELIAGAKTGSFSSPEYKSERDLLRQELVKKREEYPILGPLAEATGSTIVTTAAPFLRGAPVFKELGAAALSGFGEAKEMEDVPKEALKATAIQGAMETVSPIARKVMAEDPTKILTQSIGTRSKDIKGQLDAPIIKSVERLDKAGFFTQGDAFIPKGTNKFKRNTKNLQQFFKPQTIDSLVERATQSISTLKERNKELLKGKKVPSIEVKRGFFEGIQELTYDPLAWNVEERIDLAKEIQNQFESKLKLQTGWKSGQPVPAEDLENAKRAMDAYLKGPAFEKKAIDLGIDKQALMKFRTKLDDILDSEKIGGIEYKKNNDMISDLITVSDVIRAKEASDYVDTGTRLIDNRGLVQRGLEAISPTWVDIIRSDVAKGLETPAGEITSKILKRTPVEAFTGDRSPQGMFEGVKPAFPEAFLPSAKFIPPKELIQYRIPRSTQGILENKDKVIAKMVQNKVPPDMVDTIVHALNKDHEAVSNIAPLIISQFPSLFERTKYNMFDGQFIGGDGAKAADDISKRDDLNSIQKAKMIDGINKRNKVPEGL